MRHSMDIENLTKRYACKDAPHTYVGLAPLTTELPLNTSTCIIGRSGSGKTTLLRLLAGLETADEGRITIDGQPIESLQSMMAMVFQEHRLLPWLTVEGNLKFSEHGGYKVDEAVLASYLNRLGLERFRSFYPCQLSGGLAQRVSLGRALCSGRSILLMDEPFSALDYFTRRQLERDVYRLYERERMTLIMSTHDLTEAAVMGDYILVIDASGEHRMLKNPMTGEQRWSDDVDVWQEIACFVKTLQDMIPLHV